MVEALRSSLRAGLGLALLLRGVCQAGFRAGLGLLGVDGFVSGLYLVSVGAWTSLRSA